jgi:hypothetical protein
MFPLVEDRIRGQVWSRLRRVAKRHSSALRGRRTVFFDSRLLAKLALAMGCKTFGQSFLATAYAKTLRAALREPDVQKRRQLPVRGTGYLSGDPSLAAVGAALKWSGAWVLIMLRLGELLSLAMMAPSGRAMNVLVCDEPALVNGLGSMYSIGQVWLTVPTLGEAVGPISLPDYIAHQQRVM